MRGPNARPKCERYERSARRARIELQAAGGLGALEAPQGGAERSPPCFAHATPLTPSSFSIYANIQKPAPIGKLTTPKPKIGVFLPMMVAFDKEDFRLKVRSKFWRNTNNFDPDALIIHRGWRTFWKFTFEDAIEWLISLSLPSPWLKKILKIHRWRYSRMTLN